MIHYVFDLIGIPVLIVIFNILFLLERKFKLRKRVGSLWKRRIINSLVSLPAFVLLRFLFLPVIVWLAYKNEIFHFGLNYLYDLPVWLEGIIAFLILDYGNYLWHVINHRLPFLWRYHLVHHTDLDLDITTAFRFHFGEMIGSVFFRGAFTLLSGVSPFAVLVYEILFEAATQFHHSNWKLPLYFEKVLNTLIVTPRMHGIHHSVVKDETDSNFSVIFSFWDRVHRTFKINTPPDQLVIGVPSYDNEKELTIGFLLKLPFSSVRAWEKSIPEEEKSAGANI
ncbi:MAG: sterol desaturase family protein [Bacteroidota bacterium]|nr:sterol desaturase family protein [Bacteroidota bacterium]